MQQGESSFRTLGIHRERAKKGLLVCSPLYIEPNYVTRSELVEGKLSKSGKNFDKVSGLLFFSQKKKV